MHVTLNTMNGVVVVMVVVGYVILRRMRLIQVVSLMDTYFCS